MNLTKHTNAGWLYEKAYFFDLSWEDGDRGNVNEQALNVRNGKLFGLDFQAAPPPLGNAGFELLTSYPGLLCGSGYPHEMGFAGELKLGFALEYCSGRPYLPGSSVKGVLRSLFEPVAKGQVPEAAPWLTQQLIELCGVDQLPAAPHPEQGDSFLTQLKLELFANQLVQAERDPRSGKIRYSYQAQPTGQRDVFFDAFAVRAGQAGYLGSDYLTPHLNRKAPTYSAFTEPVPIPFLKAMPEVVFRFDFDLHDSQLWPALTAARKEALYRRILLLTGAGAKTRVGYGQFRDPQAKDPQQQPQRVQARRPKTQNSRTQNPQTQNSKTQNSKTPNPATQNLTPTELQDHSLADIKRAAKSGKGITAGVLSVSDKQVGVYFMVDGKRYETAFACPSAILAILKPGDLLSVKVKDAGDIAKGRMPTLGWDRKL